MAFEGDAKNMAFDIPRNALWRNYSLHGGDLVLILIEFSINTMPFIPSYILIVYVISLLYLSEAFLVHRVDGVWMYPFLDTSAGPIWMGYYVGVGFVITCAFVLMYFLHRLRDQGLIKKREQQQRQKEQGRQQNQQLQQSQHQNDLGRSVYVMNDSSINTSSDQEGMNEIVYFNNNGERFAQHLDNHDDSPKNRDRSWSVGSNVSTAPTLVGVDEGRSPQDMEQDRTSSKRTNRRVPLLGGGEVAPTIPEIEESFHEDPERGLTHSGRLEVVQEGNEIEHEDSKENQHP
ncbi:hypothetical protein BGZ46_008094 [Entomortierella lignicola]|nr:hypothetical protein BGZ46_008094 [Entomortierella lignicola]